MERPDPKKCCILVPSRDGIDPECERALSELARRGYHLRFMRGVTSIDQVRCQMATDALESGFEELFWIDDDVVFNPDDVDRLRSSGLPIIGGVYPKKGEPQLAVRWKEGTTSVTLGEGGSVVEVKYASTGFLLTHASVYDALIERGMMAPSSIGQFGRRMTPYFQPMVVQENGVERYLAEDWSFCHRATEIGLKIRVDTRPRLMHVGRYAYSWDDLIPRDRVPSLTVHLD
jgi:hypothetical protein